MLSLLSIFEGFLGTEIYVWNRGDEKEGKGFLFGKRMGKNGKGISRGDFQGDISIAEFDNFRASLMVHIFG